MKYISIEQHQMLEDLTGLQHTRTGAVRSKQNRSNRETCRLGLRDPWLATETRLRAMIKNKTSETPALHNMILSLGQKTSI